MKQLFANNAKATLATSIGVSDYAVSVGTGQGAAFPDPVVGQEYFLVTLEISGAVEVMACTARVNDLLTIGTRGVEGTTISAFSAGAAVECRTTAGTLASFSKSTEKMYDIDSVELLTIPSNMSGNSYVCHSNDDAGNPIIAIKSTASYWRFSTHGEIFLSGNATAGTNSTTQLTSTSIGSLIAAPASGQYLVQFLTGALAGLVRAVTASGANTISWSTALPVAPVSGIDQFEIYKSDASILAGLLLSSGATIAKNSIMPVSATVAANNLTISLQSCILSFRNPTLANGIPNTYSLGSTTSLVVPAGATLGTFSTVTALMIVLAIDVAGTVQVAVTNALGNPVLDESTLISTTAITTGSNLSTGIYSTTAATNVPFRVLGYFYVTEATAGVWLTAPSLVAGAGALTQPGADFRYMSISYSQFGTFISSNTTISLADRGKNFQISAGIATLPAPKVGLRYRFIGATPGAGSVTAPSGVALQYPDGTYTLAGTSLIPTNSTIDLFSDGISWIITSMSGLQYVPSATWLSNPIRADQPKDGMLSVSATATANTLVVSLSPCILSFRNPTINVGASNTRILTNNLTVTIPAGATLGTISGTNASLIVVVLDNNGSLDIGVINLAGNTILDESMLVSTSVIGVTSASTTTIYSNTALTNVPFKIIGQIDITEPIAGTWNTNPTKVQSKLGLSSVNAVTTYGSQVLTGPKAPFSGSMTYGATVTFDGNVNGQVSYLTLAGNITMVAPANIIQNALYTFLITQDGAGSRTIAWNTSFKFGSLGAPVLTTTASKTDIISFVGGASNTLICIGTRMNAI